MRGKNPSHMGKVQEKIDSKTDLGQHKHNSLFTSEIHPERSLEKKNVS